MRKLKFRLFINFATQFISVGILMVVVIFLINRDYGVDENQCHLYITYLLGCPSCAVLSLWNWKIRTSKKMLWYIKHQCSDPTVKLIRGFDEVFNAPHSRYTDVSRTAIENHPDLKLLSVSEEGATIHYYVGKWKKHYDYWPFGI